MKQKIFKAEAQGDIMYIGADNLNEAQRKLQQVCGPIPNSMVQWSEVPKLPKGQELMADPC